MCVLYLTMLGRVPLCMSVCVCVRIMCFSFLCALVCTLCVCFPISSLCLCDFILLLVMHVCGVCT